MEFKSPGQIAYEGYFQRAGGKDALTDAPLPFWNAIVPVNQKAWEAAAEAVKMQLWTAAGSLPNRPESQTFTGNPSPYPGQTSVPKTVEIPKLVPKAQTQTLPIKPKP